MMFFKHAGKMAIGTRVRLLAEKLTADAALVYESYQTELLPKWFPVFYILSKQNNMSVTSIAKEIGHSHVSASKIVSEMIQAGLILEKSDVHDKRRTIVTLSKKAKNVATKIVLQYQDVSAAIDEISAEANHDLWAAIEEWETLLTERSLLERILTKKKIREAAEVKIELYNPRFKSAFRELNEEWITKYFRMEQPDFDALENPEHYILDRGGYIFIATLNELPVGVCALIPMKNNVFELAKMAVANDFRGKYIGLKLGQAVIDKAKALGSKTLYLESNTVLEPAIRLYQKLGFKKVDGGSTPYERCNIQMELKL